MFVKWSFALSHNHAFLRAARENFNDDEYLTASQEIMKADKSESLQDSKEERKTTIVKNLPRAAF